MTLNAKFLEIARSIAGLEMENFESRACPDQCVGRIVSFDHEVDDFPLRDPVIQRDDAPAVVLVMESPHFEEFIGVPGPAKGKTGIHIRRHIKTIIQGLGGPLSELILVNAIQHQCSLGVATRHYRDEVFRSLWADGGQKDFKTRLAEIYNAGDMLMNCCTGGDPHTGRRYSVTAAIRDLLGTVPVYSGPHPYGWISEQNRRAIRLVSV